ncbi:MAG: glycoside hydrolase, partial [Ruminococcus sp.]|nr:glycoside hydrolase [Ruminococcus sp.]
MNIYKRLITLAAAAITAVSASALPAMAAATPDKVDYFETENNWAKLLQYTLCFYDANMCGTGVEENNLLSWRGNCHVYDAKVPMQAIDDNHTGTNL